MSSEFSLDESFTFNIDNEIIKNSNHKKLLGANLNNRLGFDILVTDDLKRSKHVWNES